MAGPKNLTIKVGVDSANLDEVLRILRDMHDEVAAVMEKHQARIAAAAVNAVPKP